MAYTRKNRGGRPAGTGKGASATGATEGAGKGVGKGSTEGAGKGAGKDSTYKSPRATTRSQPNREKKGMLKTIKSILSSGAKNPGTTATIALLLDALQAVIRQQHNKGEHKMSDYMLSKQGISSLAGLLSNLKSGGAVST